MTSLQIHSQVDTTVEIEQKLIRQRNGKLLVDIQGKLEILVNGKCFFLEPAIALLEFGVALSKWDRMNDFYYYTMEHDEREGPIIALLHNDRGWRLDSIWREFECEERLPDYTITEAVDYFLANVDGAFMRYYGINTRDFI